LAYAIFNSPSVVGPSQQAAATILVNGCNHTLTTSRLVQEAMHVEDGELYIRWDRITAAAVRYQDHVVPAAEWHPDAAILLRLAGQLGTGGLTEATASLIITALDLDAEEEVDER
jgi:hypothetical protein